MATRNPYAEHTPTGGGGSYLKFENDTPVRVRILSNPAIFDSLYEGRRSTKYAWVVYNITEEEVQIMQLPKTGYRAVAAIAADEHYCDPMVEDYELKITRTGKAQQTKYTVVPGKVTAKITEDIQGEASDIDLVDRINASPNSERAAWVLDEVDGKRPAPEKKDVVIEDVDEENLNLDDLSL